jgi:hypothetical protein
MLYPYKPPRAFLSLERRPLFMMPLREAPLDTRPAVWVAQRSAAWSEAPILHFLLYVPYTRKCLVEFGKTMYFNLKSEKNGELLQESQDRTAITNMPFKRLITQQDGHGTTVRVQLWRVWEWISVSQGRTWITLTGQLSHNRDDRTAKMKNKCSEFQWLTFLKIKMEKMLRQIWM